MKIAYCSISKIPSKEANSVHVMKMCQAFSKYSDVTLLSSDIIKSNDDIFEYYNVDRSFSFEYIQWPKHFKARAIRYAMRIVRRCKKLKPDIAYSRDITCSLLLARAGFNTVWESHTAISGLGNFSEKQFLKLLKCRTLLKIVVITETLKKHYTEKYGIDPDRIFVAPDGADLISDKIRPKENVRSSDKLNIGYIGHLYKGKGMEIISKLVPLKQDCFFHIIGGMENDVDYWKDKLKNYSNVRFYGFVKQREAASFGLAMDVLIAPYMSSVAGAGATNTKNDLGKWMSPLKLFEYMSYKKPILCTDLPALREIIKPDVNGVMCGEEDIESWCEALTRLNNDIEFYNMLSENAFNDLSEKYTWSKRAENLIDILSVKIKKSKQMINRRL